MRTRSNEGRPAWKRPARLVGPGAAVGLMIAGAVLAGCVGETFTHGQVITPDQLAEVPVGASKEQVLLALGTPSTTGVVSGEALYYFSNKSRQPVRFLNQSTVERRIVAIYLDKSGRVRDTAEYGLKDGKVFDYLSMKTPTGGQDLSFVAQVLQGAFRPSL